MTYEKRESNVEFYFESQNQVQVCMTLEISPQHHAVVQGGNKMNLQHIRTVTGTTIMFPDLTDPHIPPLRKNTISIRGALESVLQARLMLMVSTSLEIFFMLSLTKEHFGERISI